MVSRVHNNSLLVLFIQYTVMKYCMVLHWYNILPVYKYTNNFQLVVRINNWLKNFCNQKEPVWKLQMISVTNGNLHMPTTRSTLFVVSKDEWDAKEGPWRMHCMYSSVAKGTSGAEGTLNSKKNQARSLSHCRVMRVWRHQSVSQ